MTEAWEHVIEEIIEVGVEGLRYGLLCSAIFILMTLAIITWLAYRHYGAQHD